MVGENIIPPAIFNASCDMYGCDPPTKNDKFFLDDIIPVTFTCPPIK